MNLQQKYRSVLNMSEEMNARNATVKEVAGKLHLGATVETQRQKDLIWDEIKRVGGENPHDIQADIKVTNTEYYTKHTVEKGDSLSKMAKTYYGDPMDYKRIFNANTDVLDNPNMIYPGQTLVIPFPEGRTPV
ncbi:LysM peptidoglycan-binding domain-containing protein [Neolewinella litorea]|uniref:LysM peptidoglycan-binding domain-containing protein n=1 Tax=Neolewinella litorea TaxID=2562452 RepID=A0A4S4NS35_9BACT|nr:LysM peptidoglycan-binding domain-containing protein [Neolewinella litorea]THH42045.1 LysM peptidoglycan-binding domain-containing protein [Neolewinella litorea]